MKNSSLPRNLSATFNVLVIALMVASMGMSGCVSLPVETISSPELVSTFDKADKLLANLFASYQNYTRPQFEDQISPDFAPMRGEFINQAEQGYYGGRVLSLDYFIDTALERGDTLAVTCKWEKKVVPDGASGSTIIRGTAQFIFVEELERWTLKQVRGNNPFKK